MKIGILTFHCAYNYGAVLQCYALQEILRKLGHEVEIIDYRPDYIVKPYKVFRWGRLFYKDLKRTLRSWMKEPLLVGLRFKRYKVFNEFICSKLKLSTRVVGSNIDPKYDVYVMGSDQIWNPQITKGFDPVYFGFFHTPPKKGTRIISYAASIGSETVALDLQYKLKKLLTNFDAISVRENSLATILKQITKREVATVLDPTMLVDLTTWEILAKAPKLNKKYILVYQDGRECTLCISKKLAKEMNAVVVQIPLTPFVSYRKNIKQGVSPEEFLGWIRNAACVITPSFHGTVFSIIFRKPFFCIECNARVHSLLSILGLEDRIIKRNDNPVFSLIDYEPVIPRLSSCREMSIAFLKSSI